jgi:hypothetical protein
MVQYEWMNDNFYFSTRGYANFLSWLQNIENAVLRRYKSYNVLPSDCQIKDRRKYREIVTWQPRERPASPGDLMESQSKWEKPGF